MKTLAPGDCRHCQGPCRESVDPTVVRIAKAMHPQQCSAFDGRKVLAATRWDQESVEHRHRDCIHVQNFIHWAAKAGFSVVPT